ncbi:MAG: sulfatase-like hydrolase/transferase [Verrucomicrobia bacterium]|nr:sulfatase-like hydrolase/transferase [Verrucomicrobiota bacterium]
MKRIAVLFAVAALILPPLSRAAAPAARPNIVLLLADDLGYGDPGCYGATKVKTPAIDRLARQGRLFTDAHSPCAVCTPTRYALITGREFYRYGKKWNKECLVAPGQTTLASLCKEAGYATALVGKWHLGFGEKAPDWNGELKPGPLECGFDSFFGTAMTHNEPPQVLVDNHRVVGLDPNDPIKVLPPQPPKFPHGVLQGGKSALVKHDELCALHTEKAVKFIEANKDRPFFLYYGMINVHVPITPGKRFQGSSGIGAYGDYIQELDGAVSEVLAALDRHKLSDNTLVIFTSDNGGVLHPEPIKHGHRPNAHLLGQKTDVWEGGHRIPFIARWPGHVPAATRCNAMIALTDMLATVAAVRGRKLKADEGPDSFNVLPALLDQPHDKPLRPFATIIGVGGLGIREGNWLLLPKRGSGGLSTDGPAWNKLWNNGWQNSDYTADGQLKPDAPPGQLYDLEKDPSETTNVYNDHPDVVKRLGALLDELRKKGSTARGVAAGSR